MRSRRFPDRPARLRRRALVASSAVLAAPALIPATSLGQKLPRVGYLTLQVSADENLRSFQLGMARLGYVEGRSYLLEIRRAEFDASRYVPLGLELAERCDVVVLGGPTTRAAPALSARVPVGFVYSGDPVAAGFARGLARSGGNLTGLSMMANDLAGKRLSLLKEAAPRVTRVGAVTNPGHPGYGNELEVNVRAARAAGLEFVNREVRRAEEFAPALEALIRDGCDGITSFPDALTLANRQAIIRAATAARLPTMFVWRNFTASGGLMSYGPSVVEAYARAAFFVDRILRGTKAEDLPIELPTAIELVLNAGAARALAVTFPPALIALADEVIE
jgi:putative ABC transport system substrate-binding protein